MKFTPKSEQELLSMHLIKPGIYPFSVIGAEDAISARSGKEMIKLTMTVWDDEQHAHTIRDYLLEAMQMKLLHFMNVTGLKENYEAGTLLSSDCINKSGYVEIDIQDGQKRPEGGNYPAKNSIKDYVVKPTSEAKETVVKSDLEELNDDVPF